MRDRTTTLGGRIALGAAVLACVFLAAELLPAPGGPVFVGAAGAVVYWLLGRHWSERSA